jgi:hypothetical protein
MDCCLSDFGVILSPGSKTNFLAPNASITATCHQLLPNMLIHIPIRKDSYEMNTSPAIDTCARKIPTEVLMGSS